MCFNEIKPIYQFAKIYLIEFLFQLFAAFYIITGCLKILTKFSIVLCIKIVLSTQSQNSSFFLLHEKKVILWGKIIFVSFCVATNKKAYFYFYEFIKQNQCKIFDFFCCVQQNREEIMTSTYTQNLFLPRLPYFSIILPTFLLLKSLSSS